MIFTKTDFWRAVIAGEAIAVLTIPILKNIKVFEILIRQNHGLLYLFLFLWIVFFPLLTVLGLYIVHYLTITRWPALFEVGKYGIIGLLNVFLSGGIFNFFIWITDIAKGWQIDIFILIAFSLTITNSFFWNKFWTFSRNNGGEAKKEYVKFFGVSGVVALLNAFLLHILINTVGAPSGFDLKIWANIAYFSLIPISFLGNFFGYKLFVFKRKNL